MKSNVYCDSCKKEMREGNIGQAKYICTNLNCWKSDPHWDEPKIEEKLSSEQTLSPLAFSTVWLLAILIAVLTLGVFLALAISMAKIQTISDFQEIVMPIILFTVSMIGIIMALMAEIIYLDRKNQNNKQ